MGSAQQETFELISNLVKRAKDAQLVLETFTQQQVDALAAAIVFKLSQDDIAQELAELALEETGMGRIDSKKSKLTHKIPGCFHDVIREKTVGVIDKNPETGITKVAKPVGVIGALIPSTNPEATPVFKGMLALRGRNSIIFGPHPASSKTTNKVVKIMREVMTANGAPSDAFICIENPSKQSSLELMKQCDLVMATGSGDMVKAAYSSGTPAYGVGTGNAVVVVDETVNLDETAEMIRIGKTGDNASGCSAENALLIQEDIYASFINSLIEKGGYLCSYSEKEKLQKTMWQDGRLRREIIAKDVTVIADKAGIRIPNESAFLMVEEDQVGAKAPFSGEKLSLVLTLYKYGKFDDAINLVNKITGYSGLGHSCGIHSMNEDRIIRFGMDTKTSRVIVRQPHGAANSGNWFNGLSFTFSLGCGTWGGNSVSENVTQKHFINITRIAEPINRIPLSREEILNPYLEGMKV